VRVRMPVVRRRSRRSWRRRAPRLALLALVGIGLLLAIDAIWVTTTASRELSSARDLIARGGDALQAGRIQEAEGSFRLATASAERATDALGHPAAAVARVLPIVGDDVEAASVVAEAASHIGRAGSFAVSAADIAGWDGESLTGSGAGRLADPAVIADAAPDLADASEELRLARERLASIDVSSLYGSVRDALLDAHSELEARAPALESAATMAQVLPSMLGAEGSRTYLVIVQNLSDARGSGGHVGAYGVLAVEDGRLQLNEFAPATDLGNVPPIDASPELVDRYEVFGSLIDPTAATYPPGFPASARLLVSIWASTGRPPVDGVISIDPVWMSYMLEATGPVTSRAWPEPLTAENVDDVLLRESFLTTSQDESNRLQGAIAGDLFGALVSDLSASREFAVAFARAARERHLQVYSTVSEEQAALELLGVAGVIEPSDNRLLVTWFGAGASRAGYFIEKEISYEARLAADGSAEVTVSATMINEAPSGPPSILLGGLDPRDVPAGHWSMFVNVYLPPGAEVLDSRGGLLQLVQVELGAPVVLGLVEAPSGRDETFTVTYRTPSVVQTREGVSEFVLDVVPQPALRPDRVTVSVELPDGADFVGSSRGARIADGVFTWEGAPVEPERLRVTFSV
jgi:hypothetical protein